MAEAAGHVDVAVPGEDDRGRERQRAALGMKGEEPSHQAGVVFGILRTPTEKVPEGMQRVLIMSDPTRDLGALRLTLVSIAISPKAFKPCRTFTSWTWLTERAKPPGVINRPFRRRDSHSFS